MKTGSREWHQAQIEAYTREYPIYEKYAQTLRQILEQACRVHAPLAIIQVRPKSLSSFAEKAVRKAHKYDEPVRQLTDLCGARVIALNQQEADRICDFIRAHFRVDEANSLDVRTRLSTSEFGYLSVHYVVQVDRTEIQGVKAPEEIGDRKAEIQVRTTLQHAWAAVVHDVIYKSAFQAPERWVRESARLAALLEDVDGAFSRFGEEVDLYASNYGAYMSADKVEAELKTLSTVLENDPTPSSRPGAALRIARLARASGKWDVIVERLSPFADTTSHERAAILLELGQALCRMNRGQPSSEAFRKGQGYLSQAANPEGAPPLSPDGTGEGPDRTRVEATALLAWSHRHVAGAEEKARDLYNEAFQADPANPYHLASFLEYEIFCRRDSAFLAPMRPTLLNAVATCRAHAEAGIELPWAFFTIGRFYLLLGNTYESLHAYARAVRLCGSRESSVPQEGFDEELEFLRRINLARPLPPEHDWVRRLLLLGQAVRSGEVSDDLKGLAKKKEFPNRPVVIVAGGAGGMTEEEVRQYQTYLIQAFEGFGGTVICGGTRSGIAGIIGAVAEEVFQKEGRGARAVGYLPRLIPSSASRDPRYDELVEAEGTDFTPLEPLQYWMDLIAAGVKPSEVRLLGINGGRIAAFEFRLALSLGATVGVVASSGRAASDLVKDPDWWDAGNLLTLPLDAMTLRAFVHPEVSLLSPGLLDRAARAVHEKYLEDTRHSQIDPSMQPWYDLREDFKASNRQQVAYAEAVLRKVGCGVRPTQGEIAFSDFTDAEVETMAEMEHGRWIVERLREGWRYGSKRDPDRKISPYLVPWKDLAEEVKEWDRKAVRGFPEVLKAAGLEVYKRP